MRSLLVVDLGRQPYGDVLDLQRRVARARITGDVDDDVLLLSEHYMRSLGESLRRGIRSISPGVAEAFRRYAWPGNVRELRNVIERALILEEEEVITAKHLPSSVAAGIARTPSNGARASADVDGLIQLPPDGVSVEAVEMSLVRQAMAQTGGVQKHAAKLLGLSRDQLRYRLKKLEGLQA